jgi:deazaflavin-dependent oxidoreductase (nitroreductase family)
MPLEGDYEPSPSQWVRDQVELYESSGGTEGTSPRGRPTILMTTRGAKTGKLRKTPVMRVEHEGTYAAVASLAGAPENPLWYYNLLAHPQVELRDATQTWDMTAREIHGAEKAVWWERCLAAYPDYADHQHKTEREIPVFLLEPIEN